MNPAPVSKVYFNRDIPVEVALAPVPGKPCTSVYDGPQVMFTCADGRVMYLPEATAQQIRELNPDPGEVFTIVKRMVMQGRKSVPVFEVSRPQASPLEHQLRASIAYAQQKQQGPRQVVSAPAAAPQACEKTTPTHVTPVATANGMANALKFTIDAAVEATAYAQAKGMALAFDSDAIRTMAITVFINAQGGRS